MIAIDWRNLRPLNNSQNAAFEELCCQLAAYEKPQNSSFCRKGTPDAGVECFIVLGDKTEWGWQAKYFLSMSDRQWTQLDDSVKTALEKHPRLTKYTVCIPLDRPDARIEGQKSLLDRWNERVKKWTKWATEKGMNVEFEYWGSYEILERLSREEHRGRFFFWFGKEFFTQPWFETCAQEAVDVAGPRYTPPIHVELPIAKLFDGLARTPDFYLRIKHLFRDLKKDYSWMRLSNLSAEVEEPARALQEQVQRLYLPALLLCGEAGQGKTHLFCDVANRRIAADLPTILLMGQRFTQIEPWTQMRRQLGLPENTTTEELLGALQAAAQAKNEKALIMIDALNEGEGKKMWANHLPAMLQKISCYPWISVAVSVRSSYEEGIIADGLVDEKLIRVEHHGFAEHEYQATQTFFDYYGIERPSVPLLVPEFQNPLFLKLLCKGLQESNQTRFPAGLHGVTSVFKLFVNTINQKLSDTAFCDFNPRRRLVWQVIDQLAEAMAEERKDWLFLEQAEDIANRLLPGRGYERSLFRHLVSEGVLVENGRLRNRDKWIEVVQFAYERFSDHLIVKYLLDKYLDSDKPEQAFLPDQPLSFLTEAEWRYQGLIEALCIQMPERTGKELPKAAPMMADLHSTARGFVESIVWRDPETVTDDTKHYLNKYANYSYEAKDWVLNALLTVAANPNHPYNADSLHLRLMRDEMAERDAWWSVFLHEQYGVHDAVDRLVDWAWSPENKSHIDDEAIRLCGVALAWFLTTSNRFLRDRATKALVNLFTSRLHVFQVVLKNFLKVNDLYVLERLFAVAYGCVLRSVDNQQIGALAQFVYDTVFRNGKPPAHILLRDYARGVIEYALYQGIALEIEVDKIRPPYQSEWLSDIPEPEEVEQYGKWWEGMPQKERARVAIHSSVMKYGDFSRYVLEYKVRHWSSLHLDEPRWSSPQEKFHEFVASLTQRQRKKWEGFLELVWKRQGVLEILAYEKLQTAIKTFEADECPEVDKSQDNSELNEAILKITEVNDLIALAEQKFRKTLGKKKLQIFQEQILPYLNGSRKEETSLDFELSLAQRWIVKQVFQMGWTVERFGWFDRERDRNNLREARKAERIGKKYQWIACHQFLARLADNFQYREQYSNHPQSNQYDGPWQLSLRDIDPSCVLKTTGPGSNWRQSVQVWWFPTEYQEWDSTPDDVEWMKRTDDLPDIYSLIEVTNPEDDSRWLALNGFYHWEQPTSPEEERTDLTRREIWYILRGYLVYQQDCDELYEWAVEQNFMGGWMPEGPDLYEVFLGEFYWSSAYACEIDPYKDATGWQGDNPDSRIPTPIMPLVETYKKGGGFDCSIDDGFSITAPTHLVANKMGLSWNGSEGKYFNKSGELIAFDPSVTDNGPGVLLIHREAFLSFLQENDYRVMWTILGEKQLIGGGYGPKNWKGRLELSGAFRIQNSQLTGEITPKFSSPNDRG